MDNEKPPPNFSRTCSICLKFGCYKYYGAMSCEGCKQFFYRTIMNKKFYSCKINECPSKNGPITSIIYCKACRLEKCLQVGMIPKVFDGGEDYMEEYNRRKIEEKNDRVVDCSPVSGSNCNSFSNELSAHSTGGLQSMAGIYETNSCTNLTEEKQNEEIIYEGEKQHNKNWEIAPNTFPSQQNFSFLCSEQNRDINVLISLKNAELRNKLLFDLPIGISAEKKIEMDRFTNLRQYLVSNDVSLELRFGGAIFGTFNHLKSTMQCDLSVLARHLLLVIELAKTMPSYGKLTLDDQELLLSNVVQPVLHFNNAVYSWQQNRRTMVYNGVEMIKFDRVFNDGTIEKLGRLMRSDYVEKFHEIGLVEDELLLVRAIILSHFATSGLSPAGCDLLQQQANKFAGILLKLLQIRLDSLAGARKYVEAMQLIQATFRAGQHFYEYMNYVNIFYYPNAMERLMPKFLIPFCIRGSL